MEPAQLPGSSTDGTDGRWCCPQTDTGVDTASTLLGWGLRVTRPSGQQVGAASLLGHSCRPGRGNAHLLPKARPLGFPQRRQVTKREFSITPLELPPSILLGRPAHQDCHTGTRTVVSPLSPGGQEGVCVTARGGGSRDAVAHLGVPQEQHTQRSWLLVLAAECRSQVPTPLCHWKHALLFPPVSSELMGAQNRCEEKGLQGGAWAAGGAAALPGFRWTQTSPSIQTGVLGTTALPHAALASVTA